MKNPTGRPKPKATKNTNAPQQTKPIDWRREPENIEADILNREKERRAQIIRDAGRLQIELGDAERKGQRKEANRLRREIECLGSEHEAGEVDDRHSGKAPKPTKVRRNARPRPEHLTAEQRNEFNRAHALPPAGDPARNCQQRSLDRSIQSDTETPWIVPGMPDSLKAFVEHLALAPDRTASSRKLTTGEYDGSREPSALLHDCPKWKRWWNHWIEKPKRGVYHLKTT